MYFQEHVSLKAKTTMRIGGTARYFAELKQKSDIEEAVTFTDTQKVPLVVLGGGSNTIFADGEIQALVVRIKADAMSVRGNFVTVEAGKILAVLINELAEENLDLSALTGIPGSVGGAIFGNAGQGPKGLWIDTFVEEVTAYVDGTWRTLSKVECHFRYRESWFKDRTTSPRSAGLRGIRLVSIATWHQKMPLIIWSVRLKVPSRPASEVKTEVERLLQKRIATQPHRQTAGSCFKAVGGTPAWQLIDAAGLRGYTVCGVQVSEKHANFLLNVGDGTFNDAQQIVEEVQAKVSEPLEVEMQFVQEDGTVAY